jgi:hypothetical protein
MITALKETFGNRLRCVILFGSRARGQEKETSDHDILIIINDLPNEPIARLKQVRMCLINVPLRINTISKTPDEIEKNLTPLMLDIFVDGVCLFGKEFFEPLHTKALKAIQQSGLMRRRIGREWCWEFEKTPQKDWELTWEGYHEFS